MLKLLVLADDFTGALDTGVKFADNGISTQVIAARSVDFTKISSEIVVLVVDLQTRHQRPEVAYEVVYQISKEAHQFGIPYILKKTDSALRGNIGSELTALYDATGRSILSFIPALPSMARTTVNGIHLIEGIPVSESVFAKDPFTPVKHGAVSDIIKEQSAVRTHVASGECIQINQEGIWIFDSETDADLLATAKKLQEKNLLAIMAGCSGIGAVLPEVLELEGNRKRKYQQPERFVVICGSVNPITTGQVLYAEQEGFMHIALSLEEKMEATFWGTAHGQKRVREIVALLNSDSKGLISSFDQEPSDATLEYGKQHGLTATQVGACIAASIGRLLKEMIAQGLNATFLVTGGDTLLGFMRQIDHYELDMITEISPGSVLSQLSYKGQSHQIISKSGGFGSEDLLVEIAKKLNIKA